MIRAELTYMRDAASLSSSRIFLARRHHPRKTRLGVQAAITPSKNHCAAAIINPPYQMISKLKLVDFPLVADGSLCKIAHIHAPSMPIIAGYFALQASDARQSYIFPMPLLPHGARMDAKGYLRLRRHASTTPESVAAHEVRCPRFVHAQAISASREQDYWQVRLRKHARRSNNSYEILAAHQRHFPIYDRDVGIRGTNGVERGNTVRRLVDRLRANMHQHHARELPRVLILIRHNNVETFDQFLEFFAGHVLRALNIGNGPL
jgi:hypothetical protein